MGHHDGVRSKLLRWYWCGVLGELYGGTVETRFAKDLPKVLAWVDGGPEPTTVTEATFSPARLLTLRTRNSAAYKGLYALLLRDGALDFQTGQSIDIQKYFHDQVDIHHVFPSRWCDTHQIEGGRADSIINKTPLSAVSNRQIQGDAPSEYLERVQRRCGIDRARMDEILRSHAIETEAMWCDDVESFFSAREAALLHLIEAAMGKPVVRGVPTSGEDDIELEDVEAEAS